MLKLHISKMQKNLLTFTKNGTWESSKLQTIKDSIDILIEIDIIGSSSKLKSES
jgi:hypothetical protein